MQSIAKEALFRILFSIGNSSMVEALPEDIDNSTDNSNTDAVDIGNMQVGENSTVATKAPDPGNSTDWNMTNLANSLFDALQENAFPRESVFSATVDLVDGALESFDTGISVNASEVTLSIFEALDAIFSLVDVEGLASSELSNAVVASSVIALAFVLDRVRCSI